MEIRFWKWLLIILGIIGFIGWLSNSAEAANPDNTITWYVVNQDDEIRCYQSVSEYEAAPVAIGAKAYTDYRVAQNQILNSLIVCEDGYLRDDDGFIAAALGSYFGGYHADSIGTRWIFVCSDGTEIPIVKVDVKHNDHTLDDEHMIGTISGRYDELGNPIRCGEYIEFYVDTNIIDGLIYTNSNPCINTTPGMDGDIVGWYQINKIGELEK